MDNIYMYKVIYKVLRIEHNCCERNVFCLGVFPRDIIEFNYYDLVSLMKYLKLSHKRLCAPIFCQESEEFLSSLVVNKTIYAKVDRLAGIINFQRPKDPNDLLNDWSHKLNSLMSLVNKTTHLIAKEEMIHNLQ